MKKPRFTDSQIIAVLKQAEAASPSLSYAANTGSARPRCTSGVASSAVWTRR